MRCIACNKALGDFESTRKDSEGQFVDLCNYCYGQSGIYAEEREDLRDEEVIIDEDNDPLTNL